MRGEKLHAVVARSTFASQNVQNTPCADHFWQLRCRKSARRCGAKHFSKSKCTKHTIVDHLWKLRCQKNACRRGAMLFQLLLIVRWYATSGTSVMAQMGTPVKAAFRSGETLSTQYTMVELA